MTSDIVAISIPIGAYQIAHKLLLSIFSYKKSKHEPLIVLGGNVPSIAYNEIFQYFPRTDLFIVVGEGEESFSKILKHIDRKIDINSIPNLVRFSNGRIVKNYRKMPSLKDIIAPPYISDDIYKFINDNGGLIYLETSRGCYNNCTFCFKHTFYTNSNDNIRYFPIERFKLTLKQILNKKHAHFTIKLTDQCLISDDNPERINSAFQHINDVTQTLATSSYKGKLVFETRIDSLYNQRESIEDQSLRSFYWEQIIKANLDYVVFGLESCCNTQLKRYGKSYNIETIEGAVKKIKTMSIPCQFNMIMLDPLMTIDELNYNLNEIERLQILEYITSLSKELRITKGTPYYHLAKKYGIKIALDRENLTFYKYSYKSYIDPKISYLIPYLRTFYKVFNDSGYRFAGIEMFLNFKNIDNRNEKAINNILYIPRAFKNLEFSIIKYILSNTGSKELYIINEVKWLISNIVYSSIKSVQESLLLDMYFEDKQILKTFLKILNDISKNTAYFSDMFVKIKTEDVLNE